MASGERAAVVEFLEEKREPLLRFIQRSMSDRLAAKVEPADIFQEVSVTALSSYEEIDFTERDPFHWLCGLAERRIIDAHRRHFSKKRAADKEVGLDAPVGGELSGGLIDVLTASLTSPSQNFSKGQKEFALLAALDQLPEEAREAIRLRYIENLPSKEIAARLGKTDGATRVLLTRSLKKLQDLLSENDLFQSMIQKPEV
ncbi:MAG: sigma-70 family RNA polymerase sigma factor [Planctomycetaceae bacterium]|nr:sigma-70 family RNA polymerase sigma factor [Planctomycetaceae bacterium]